MALTKIVCTAGPSAQDKKTLTDMYKAGMNVVRVNLSHASPVFATQICKTARSIAPDLAVLFDTKGPELRTGNCEEPIVLKKNAVVNVSLMDGICNPTTLFIRGAAKNTPFNVGDSILISDGTVELEVISTRPLRAKARANCVINANKNVSIPTSAQAIEKYLSKKDIEDIKLAKKLGVDFIAASFIRNADDIRKVRKIAPNVMIVSKIEHAEAIKNIDEIIAQSDGIMVARGDLGLSVPLEDVPLLQKLIIQKCNQAATPVITATQVLESMTVSPRPTRAEASDVTNAIFDGTDAIMLSGETANGKYPVRAVDILSRISAHTESQLGFNVNSYLGNKVDGVQEFICKSAYSASFELKADAIVTHTSTGSTARLIAQFRPRIPILAIVANSKTFRELSLSYGVTSFIAPHGRTTDEELQKSAKLIMGKKVLPGSAKVVVTIGSHPGRQGKTDLLRVGTLKQLSEKRFR